MDISRVNRVELIELGSGRKYVKYHVKEVSFSLQDNKHTLKIFVTPEELEEEIFND
jgi:hypothetical protein